MNLQFRHVLIASLPAALAGNWNLGRQVGAASIDASSAWQLALLEQVGIYHEGMRGFMAMLAGLAFFAPLLVLCLAVSRLWAEVFARLRGKPPDAGWYLTAWLYTLLLPATISPGIAALGLSFGVVFGSHVFGGTGRYIVNPALLGIVFVVLAYPPAMEAWLPGDAALSTWAEVGRVGFAAGIDQGNAFWPVFLGQEVGAMGATSALACLLGAAYLIAVRLGSLPACAAALAGLAIGSALIGDLPWYWHLALGNFAFLLAFILTDTATRPLTTAGAIAYGGVFAFTTIAIRMANPEHPEGSWFALLIATLAVPLFDYLSTAARLRRLPDSELSGHE